MSVFQSLVLGVIQGLTEFLPVSSSGHLILIPSFLGWDVQPLVFDTVLHLGTAFALILYYWKDLLYITSSFLKEVSEKKKDVRAYSHEGKMLMYIVVGSIPAGIFGLLLGNVVEDVFRNVISIVIFLVLGSILMHLAEFVTRMPWNVHRMPDYDGSDSSIDLKKSVVVGFFQSLALFPGFSRSGTTISGGMFVGLSREYATKFSFLLSVPIVVAATAFKVIESFEVVNGISYISLGVGFLSSFIVGLLAIKFLLSFLKKYSLYWFVMYRVILAGVIVYLTFFV